MAGMTTREEIEAQLQKLEPEQLALLAQIIRSLTTHTGWDRGRCGMGQFVRGEVVVIPFPFSDLSAIGVTW